MRDENQKNSAERSSSFFIQTPLRSPVTEPSKGCPLKIGIPKGRMYTGVVALLSDAGLDMRPNFRQYRPLQTSDEFDVKILKPKNILEMLQAGSRDIGFAGSDWVDELEASVVELIDTGLDPIRIVAAAPEGWAPQLNPVAIRVASEYPRHTARWIERSGLNAVIVPSFGATEVFPPEDADCIVDCVASGETLRANGLRIIDDIAASSSRLYANPRALEDPARRDAIDVIVLLLRSVLEGRRRVMLEINAPLECLEGLTRILPSMRRPTVSSLHGEAACAVKVAVPRADVRRLIPLIRAAGGTDLVVSAIDQIIP
jgi:ATP phosphoribosyltransferase